MITVSYFLMTEASADIENTYIYFKKDGKGVSPSDQMGILQYLRMMSFFLRHLQLENENCLSQNVEITDQTLESLSPTSRATFFSNRSQFTFKIRPVNIPPC